MLWSVESPGNCRYSSEAVKRKTIQYFETRLFATVLSEKEGKLQCAPLQGKLISSVALINSQQHTVQEGGRVKVVSFFFKKKDREIRSKTIKKKKKQQGAKGENTE